MPTLSLVRDVTCARVVVAIVRLGLGAVTTFLVF
jgi:hypothetical protein